jgi:aminoglycoside phosphotransferase (APT) family kinase protein
MENNSSVSGVLNFEQLEKFCERFNLLPSQIKANFDGWRKLVLYTEELIFLFPRDPRGIEWLEKEALAYEIMESYDNLPVPKLVERVSDKEISYYDFVVVTRINGTAYAKFEDEVDKEDVRKMLLNLTQIIPLWHETVLKENQIKILKAPSKKVKNISLDNWEQAALDPGKVENALLYLQGVIEYWGKRFNFHLTELLISKAVFQKWSNCLSEIASLKPAFIHGDIHEDQILLESKETMIITGIIDWETVKFANPIWDFDLGEWGLKIWEWREFFSEFRREIWKIYLDKRKITLETLEGLDLFYSIYELLWVLRTPEKKCFPITGLNYEGSIQYYLEKLVNISEKI